ncbi:MAG: hypothetical protein AAGA48_15395 [Myxococcota bacterium]
MGIRVRKLARELRTSPRDVLQLLKSLGFERYQSPDDMISDTVAARVLSQSPGASTPAHALRAGDPARSRPRPPSPPPATGNDVMAQLVPGVTRTRPDQRSGSLRAAEESALQRQRTEVARQEASLKARQESLDGRERAVEAREAQVQAEALRVEALLESVDQREALLVSEQTAFEEARKAFVAEQQLRAEVAAATTANVVELFRERGIRGMDEVQRALGALANGHVLGPFVRELAVQGDEAFRQLLAERLVLVGGEIPEGLTGPAVSVAPDRADVPGAAVVRKSVGKLGEQWLLHGFRSVTIAGMPPKWHGIVRAMVDPRVTLSFAPSSPGLPERLGPSEAWFVWGGPHCDEVPSRVFFVPADEDLVLWFQRATRALMTSP